jgi:hypothetical protein
MRQLLLPMAAVAPLVAAVDALVAAAFVREAVDAGTALEGDEPAAPPAETAAAAAAAAASRLGRNKLTCERGGEVSMLDEDEDEGDDVFTDTMGTGAETAVSPK